MYCTYNIKCIISGKSYYGSTTNFKKRMQQHRYLLSRNMHHSSHLQNAWNKYNESSFEFNIIEIFDSSELMLGAEKHLLDSNIKHSYNISTEVNKAHMLGRHHSNETKQKLKDMFTGKKVSNETIEKIKIARSKQVMQKGRKHTKEAIEKIKAKRALQVMKSGWKMSEESKNKMRMARLGRKFPRHAN